MFQNQGLELIVQHQILLIWSPDYCSTKQQGSVLVPILLALLQSLGHSFWRLSAWHIGGWSCHAALTLLPRMGAAEATWGQALGGQLLLITLPHAGHSPWIASKSALITEGHSLCFALCALCSPSPVVIRLQAWEGSEAPAQRPSGTAAHTCGWPLPDDPGALRGTCLWAAEGKKGGRATLGGQGLSQ